MGRRILSPSSFPCLGISTRSFTQPRTYEQFVNRGPAVMMVKPQELPMEGLPANSASMEESRLYNFEQQETPKMILLIPKLEKR